MEIHKKQRWKMICAYDGTSFLGWQSQVHQPTVQDTLEKQLLKIFKRPIRLHGSSRTDTGVHARAQVAHFDADWPHGPQVLLNALQSTLPDSLQIISIEPVSHDFHARYGTKRKRYSYHLTEGLASPFLTRYSHSLKHVKLDVDAIQEASQHLIGTHDFKAFGANRPGGAPTENTVKTLYQLDWNQEGPRHTLWTEGSGYLYKMVRLIVGGLLRVGEGKITPNEFKRVLDAKKRPPLIISAPANGLFLEEIFYE